ncbi:MAG: hypothetical protein LBG45_05825 [Dysgonamonadaceae bacterium]|jgi:hypothetical protein|nr:hypothetical protein [Dysgonamonadaceae bacterium]
METTALRKKRAKPSGKSESETLIEELKAAILETEAMAKDIRKNGTKGYKTMDELLAEC